MSEPVPRRNPETTKERPTSWLDTVCSFTTEKGSVYTVLPDGKTQRHKKALTWMDENQHLKDPQELMAFLPPWEFIEKNAPEKIKRILGEDKHKFTSSFAAYFRGSIEGYKGYIIDKNGQILRTTQEILASEGPVFAVVVEKKTNEALFHVPVSKEPSIGKTPIDMNRTPDPDDETAHITSRHVGHEIIEIEQKK